MLSLHLLHTSLSLALGLEENGTKSVLSSVVVLAKDDTSVNDVEIGEEGGDILVSNLIWESSNLDGNVVISIDYKIL